MSIDIEGKTSVIHDAAPGAETQGGACRYRV